MQDQNLLKTLAVIIIQAFVGFEEPQLRASAAAKGTTSEKNALYITCARANCICGWRKFLLAWVIEITCSRLFAPFCSLIRLFLHSLYLFPPSTLADAALSSLTRANTAIRTGSKHCLRWPRCPVRAETVGLGRLCLTFDLCLSSEDSPSTLAKRECTHFCVFAWLSTEAVRLNNDLPKYCTALLEAVVELVYCKTDEHLIVSVKLYIYTCIQHHLKYRKCIEMGFPS